MGKVLVFAPHPDDETLGLAGAITRHITGAQEVRVVFLTSGERGIPGVAPEKALEIREEEARTAAKLLGYTIEGFWRLPDGQLRYSIELRDRVRKLIEIEDPELVYVTHEQESHQDHRVAGRLVREALKTILWPPECLTYEIWTPLQYPSRVMNISAEIETKIGAIQAYKSQLGGQNFQDAAIGLARYRGVINGRCEYAEAFGRMRTSGESGMKVALSLLTYAPSADHPRAEYARTTLTSVLKNLDIGPGNQLHVHIADDGSDPEHIKKLIEICAHYGQYEVSVTNAERGGYGKSYNLACQALHESYDLIIPLEDDWELVRYLNLQHAIKVLEDKSSGIRSIRLGYLGITQDLIGTVVFKQGQTYLLLDPNSPEPHVFCGHPRIETVEYQRDIGAWPEGLRAGETEWEITHRQSARVGVAWPLDLSIPASQDWGSAFSHIGTVSLNQTIPEGAIHSV